MKLPATPWRALLALAAAVLLAHLWLLGNSPGALHAPSTLKLSTLVTRTIVLAPASAGVAATPSVLPQARTARAAAAGRPPAPRPDQPEPAAAQPPPAESAFALPSTPAQPPSGTPAPAFALAIPGSVLLRYKVTAHARKQLWQADGELHWRHDGSDYEARLQLSAPPLPSRVQHSIGRITAEGLAPRRFSDKARSEEAAHFQRDEGKVSFSANRPDAALMPGAQDRLSVLLQLGSMIAGDRKKFPAGTTIAIQTASTRDAEAWQFTVEGEEQLELPGATLTTLKLTRQPRKEFDQKVEIWLAPDMDYVPVRLRLTQPNGDWVDQQWSSTDRG